MLGSRTLILTSTYPADLSPPTSHHRRLRRRFIINLHILSFLSSIISVSLFAAAIPLWNKNFFHNTGPNRGDWTDGIVMGPLASAMLYHAIILIQASMQKSQKRNVSTNYDPSLGWSSMMLHTTVPCLVLLSLLPVLLLAAYGSLFRFWQPAVRTQSGILVCNMLNIFSRECEPTLYDIGSLQMAGIAFGTIVWSVHFVLLLVSLRNLRRARLAKQLQEEKIAQYARSERKSSRGSRRGYASPQGSTRSQGMGAHVAWHQYPPLERSRSSRGNSSSNSKPESGTTLRSRSNSLGEGSVGVQRNKAESDAREQQGRREVPILFIRAPEESHPPSRSRGE